MGTVAAGLCGLAAPVPVVAPALRPMFVGRVHDSFIYEVDMEQAELRVLAHRHMYPELYAEWEKMERLGNYAAIT